MLEVRQSYHGRQEESRRKRQTDRQKNKLSDRVRESGKKIKRLKRVRKEKKCIHKKRAPKSYKIGQKKTKKVKILKGTSKAAFAIEK